MTAPSSCAPCGGSGFLEVTVDDGTIRVPCAACEATGIDGDELWSDW
ncbi:DnaJ-class molecular chaperone [Saccharomonospora amisosensis]|uniref:DnaJ-class molecular chaperone n=1 Tax=Saccharomonospora amisosensis TaxID=1128677 RepID=A0A7X5UMV4_9PSEU|nr:hypothetical protein [Saccharomonospora amisosensis]NIJ10642.1 DnaJ-class molecular chaperone [Saccharomonospora amisosensis]